MIFDKNILEYLDGKKFSNGAIVSLEEKAIYPRNRDDYLVNIVQNKKIIHLGFVDHLPLIDNKIEQGQWLHNKLIDSANLCIGVDINEEGIRYLESNHNINNLYILNIVEDILPEPILNETFDYLLIPDVIEHISNPQQFLSSIREKLKDNVKEIIITTPNAFRWNNFMNIFKNKECINTDHRFWFTPYTLSKVLYDSFYDVEEIIYLEHGKLSRREVIKKIILNKYPAFRDTLVAVSSFKNE